MEKICHISRSFEEADDYDRQQAKRLTPNERIRISRQLRKRFYSTPQADVREWHRKQ
jgi:hypothetical protein